MFLKVSEVVTLDNANSTNENDCQDYAYVVKIYPKALALALAALPASRATENGNLYRNQPV